MLAFFANQVQLGRRREAILAVDRTFRLPAPRNFFCPTVSKHLGAIIRNSPFVRTAHRMPTGSKRIPLALAFGASMFLLGCAPKKPIASTQPSFRVETFHHDALLFAPTIPASQSSTAPVRLN